MGNFMTYDTITNMTGDYYDNILVQFTFKIFFSAMTYATSRLSTFFTPYRTVLFVFTIKMVLNPMPL